MKQIEKRELLPAHYTEVSEPSYMGKGVHNVINLEEIIEGYKELVHQLRLREQAILNKFSISIVISESDKKQITGEEKHKLIWDDAFKIINDSKERTAVCKDKLCNGVSSDFTDGYCKSHYYGEIPLHTER